MPTLAVTTDVTDTAAGTNTTITALSIAVAANRMYYAEYNILWTISDITDGAQFILDAPGTPTNFAFTAKQALTGTTETILNSITDGGEISATTAVGTTGNITTIKCFLKTPTAGELILQVDSEATADVVVKGGSFVNYRDLGAV